MAFKKAQAGFQLPLTYSLFFLFLEPLSALTNAFYTHLQQPTYLSLLTNNNNNNKHDDNNNLLPLSTSVVMSQLASMYLFFALNEALVLRTTTDIRVWRVVLVVLLLADLGRLWALKGLGLGVYWDFAGWNLVGALNVPLVYFCVVLRLCFLSGVGLGKWTKLEKRE